MLEKCGISADTALRLARYRKQKEIERDVARLAAASRDGSRSESELEAALPHRHFARS